MSVRNTPAMDIRVSILMILSWFITSWAATALVIRFLSLGSTGGVGACGAGWGFSPSMFSMSYSVMFSPPCRPLRRFLLRPRL